jgi:hypothetical protein
MSATAASWFYRTPEKDPYLLGERVNGTFWEARLGGVWLQVVKALPPFEMAGTYHGADIQLAWEPNKWLRLASAPPAPALAKALANILRRRPGLRYEAPDGFTVWEWWLEGSDKRWQEIQGKPAYRNPARLDRDN